MLIGLRPVFRVGGGTTGWWLAGRLSRREVGKAGMLYSLVVVSGSDAVL
jgi:hypothetical protein